MKISSVFGNAPMGDHPAIFIAAETVKYPKGLRRVFGFLVLNVYLSAPLQNDQGHPIYSVDVCNASKGKNPKSKPHKICKAMLQPDEYDPIDAALEVPEPGRIDAALDEVALAINQLELGEPKLRPSTAK